MVIVKEPSCDSTKVYTCIHVPLHAHVICTSTCMHYIQYNIMWTSPYTDQVCDLVLGKVPGSQVVTDVGAELSFILPSTATHHFPSLFDTLEGQTTRSSCFSVISHKMYISTADQRDLGVSSYGISVTTMEEVFMKVREGADETLKCRLLPPFLLLRSLPTSLLSPLFLYTCISIFLSVCIVHC